MDTYLGILAREKALYPGEAQDIIDALEEDEDEELDESDQEEDELDEPIQRGNF